MSMSLPRELMGVLDVMVSIILDVGSPLFCLVLTLVFTPVVAFREFAQSQMFLCGVMPQLLCGIFFEAITMQISPFFPVTSFH